MEQEIMVKEYTNGLTLYQRPLQSNWIVRNNAGHWLGTWDQTATYRTHLRGERPAKGLFLKRTYHTYKGWERAVIAFNAQS